MNMEWLWKHLNDGEQQQVRDCLAAFAQVKPDRSELTRIAAALEELEKQFVPLNPEQAIPPGMQGSVLVCTVGFRPMPVILTALLLRPSRLYLLHSADSRTAAESVRDDPFVRGLGLDPVQDILLREISLIDAPKNYSRLHEIVRDNLKQAIVVDISGGVKVMGTSLAAAAFWLRLPVIYQLGHEVLSVVQPFSERLTLLQNPFVYFGSTDLRSIQDHFASGDYDAALTIAENLRESTGDVTTLGRLNILLELIGVYRDWDAFLHSILEDRPERKLAARLRAVSAKMERMELHFMDDARREDNITFLQQVEGRWRPGARSLNDEYRLMDIYTSALRRAAAGKYDDAVARLYRCLEMAASLLLARDCGIADVRDPDLTYFVTRLSSETALEDAFRKVARYNLPKGQALGLKDQMTLLAISGNRSLQTVGGIFQGLEGNRLLEKRNRSILAHGTVSVPKSDYELFLRGAQDVVSLTVGEDKSFRRLCEQAAHPPISIEF